MLLHHNKILFLKKSEVIGFYDLGNAKEYFVQAICRRKIPFITKTIMII